MMAAAAARAVAEPEEIDFTDLVGPEPRPLPPPPAPVAFVAPLPANDVDLPELDIEIPMLVRARATGHATFPDYHLTREERRAGALIVYPDVERPKTRGDCEGGDRPCPWISCKWNLYLDVLPGGSIKLNHPQLEPWELKETCALDVADRQGITLEEVGQLYNITRERVRQVEMQATEKVRRRVAAGVDLGGGGS